MPAPALQQRAHLASLALTAHIPPHITHKPVALIQVRLPGAFNTCFYNHARRLRLEKRSHLGLSRSLSRFLNHFWIQVTASVPEVKWPSRSRFRSKAVTNL